MALIVYTLQQFIVKEKNGLLSDILHTCKPITCNSKKELKKAITKFESENPAFKKVKYPFSPRTRWAYLESQIYVDEKLDDVTYYEIKM